MICVSKTANVAGLAVNSMWYCKRNPLNHINRPAGRMKGEWMEHTVDYSPGMDNSLAKLASSG